MGYTDPVVAYIAFLGPDVGDVAQACDVVVIDPCVQLVAEADELAVVRFQYNHKVVAFGLLTRDVEDWAVTDQWDATKGGRPPDWVLGATEGGSD